MLKVRRSRDRLLCNMGILITGKDGRYIEMGAWTFSSGAIGLAMTEVQMDRERKKYLMTRLHWYVTQNILYIVNNHNIRPHSQYIV